MFRASLCPSTGAKTTAVAASGLPLELGDSSAVGPGQAGCGGSEPRSDPPQPARPRTTALLSPSSDGKPQAATAVTLAA
jgi:hypothetical protein